MKLKTTSLLLSCCAVVALNTPAFAQENVNSDGKTVQNLVIGDDQSLDNNDQPFDPDVDGILTDEELDQLVGPIALYPDTLLIQVLVAATFPIEIIKANRFVDENTDLDQDDLNAAIEAENWDPSVAVLAEAFPTVLANMAEHIDWTQLAGDAMLAQSEDVMDAVQRMREQAAEFGNLESNDEQIVTKDETDAIVILPADPEVVYVPTYDSSSVYYRNDALIAWTTFIVIGAIWRNNNHWHNYWGCRNCGGWNGRPIHHRPNNINVNGNVNIGNNVIGGGRDDGWKPDDRKKDRAKTDISDRKREGGQGKADRSLGKENGGRGDDMRRDLSNKTGTRDISKPGVDKGARPATGAVGGRDLSKPAVGGRDGPSTRPVTKKPAVSKPSQPRQPQARPATKPAAKPAARPATKPAARPATKPQARPSTHNNNAFKSNGGGNKARSSASRGGASRGGSRGGGGGGRRR